MRPDVATSMDIAAQALNGTLEYLHTLADRPVVKGGALEQARAMLDLEWPTVPGDPRDTVARLQSAGEASAVATAGGRFYGLVVGGSLPAAMGARILNSGWDQLATTDQTSPLAHVADQVAGRWALEALGLPPHCAASFVSGASMANLHGLVIARQTLLKRAGWDCAENGLAGAPALRIVASQEAHSTVLKMLTMLGFGRSQIETIPCDAQGRAIARALPPVDERTIVILQAGNVNTGACDPFAEIADRIAGTGAWLHIDGAFGLWAAASPALRYLVTGIERADSWAVDGHKWLNVPYDSAIAICAHPAEVVEVMGNGASYLTSGGGIVAKDMVLELSRSARGLECWAALHSLGRSGLAELIERTCRHARSFAAGLEALGFTVLHDVTLNVVCATLDGREDRVEQLAARVRDSGECWFGTTHWQGHTAIRICVSSWMTDEQDVARSLEAIGAALTEL